MTATDVNFGTYAPLSSSNLDGTGVVTVNCTLLADLAGSLNIDLSTGSSGTYANRKMKNGSSTLQYNLYTNPARNQVWGNGTGGSVRVTRTFTGLLVLQLTNTVYGRIPGSQNVASGSYADSILITVTY